MLQTICLYRTEECIQLMYGVFYLLSCRLFLLSNIIKIRNVNVKMDSCFLLQINPPRLVNKMLL